MLWLMIQTCICRASDFETFLHRGSVQVPPLLCRLANRFVQPLKLVLAQRLEGLRPAPILSELDRAQLTLAEDAVIKF